MDFTLAQVVGRNQFLNQRMLAVQSLLNSLRSDGISVGGLSPSMKIPFSRAAILWEFGAVVARGILPQDGMMVLIQMFRKQLLEHAELWEKRWEAKEDQWQPQILSIHDRKLAHIQGENGYYDLQQCAMVNNAPPAFEGVSYNLAVPVRLELLQLQQEAKDGSHSHSQRNNPGSVDPRNSVAGHSGRPTGPGGPAMGPADRTHGAAGNSLLQTLYRNAQQSDGGDRASDDGRVLQRPADVHPDVQHTVQRDDGPGDV